MRERPIIFSGEMIRAILDGRKTMTRRPVKPQPYHNPSGYFWKTKELFTLAGLRETLLANCPHGQPGDRLWVKETWTQDINIAEGATGTLYYRANDNFRNDLKWKSPRFMPRWASRITLEIVKVGVERLQEITEEDCIKEGFVVTHSPGNFVTAAYSFLNYWNSLYTKKPELQWKTNPWVWVIEFKRISLQT